MADDSKHLDPIRTAIEDFIGEDKEPGTIDVQLTNGAKVVIISESAYIAMSAAYQKIQEQQSDAASGLTTDMNEDDKRAMDALFTKT